MINIDEKLEKEIIQVSEMMGISADKFVGAALEKEMVFYRNAESHKIEAVKGEFWENHLECTLHPETKPVWKPCFILDKRQIYNYPYFAILSGSSSMSVPVDCVRKADENDSLPDVMRMSQDAIAGVV